MSGTKALADTNVLLPWLKGDEDIVWVFEKYDVQISIVTRMESLSYPKISTYEIMELKYYFNTIIVHRINEDIEEATIAIRRQHRLKLPDAIIAATALTLDIPLLTFDKAFTKVDGLQVVVPQV